MLTFPRPFAFTLCAALCTAIHAQDSPPPASTITINTQVVAIDALVRDPGGTLLLNLGKDAFTLKVDGKPTPIRYFNRDNDLPLTIGLMIDTSGSQRVYFDEEELSSDIFFTNILMPPKDRALIVGFNSRVLLLQPMTARLKDLQEALRRLDYSNPTAGVDGNGTLLYDAVATVSKTVTSSDGRRALVILTDGEDVGSRTSLSEAIHAAQLAGVAVYSVLYTREMIGGTLYPAAPGSLRPSGVAVMRQISKATGGREFIVGGNTSISQIFTEIEHDLRSQYRFGFTPPPSRPGKFHALDLRTGDKHQNIQTRAGYYSPE